LSKEEVEHLTAKIVDSNRYVADELAVEARDSAQFADHLPDDKDDTVRKWDREGSDSQEFSLDADEFLNTPTMRAERRRHEIGASGGFIVSDDELVGKDEVFPGGIARSVRNIALIVLVCAPIIGYFVVPPERINQLFGELNSIVQSMLAPKSTPLPSEEADQISKKENSSANSTQETISSRVVKNQLEPKRVEENPIVENIESQQDIDEKVTSTVKGAGEDYIATQSKYEQIVVNEAQPPSTVEPIKERKFQVFFEANNTEIPKEFIEMLNDLYIVLSLNEQAILKISGYADSDPSDDPLQNMRLSLERAQTVSSYFIERGIDSSRIQIEGHSPSMGSTNLAQEALEKHLGNKRVELLLRDGLN
jgi:outer membrane protein OmpA-like peptidoglycan-associated protein